MAYTREKTLTEFLGFSPGTSKSNKVTMAFDDTTPVLLLNAVPVWWVRSLSSGQKDATVVLQPFDPSNTWSYSYPTVTKSISEAVSAMQTAGIDLAIRFYTPGEIERPLAPSRG